MSTELQIPQDNVDDNTDKKMDDTQYVPDQELIDKYSKFNCCQLVMADKWEVIGKTEDTNVIYDKLSQYFQFIGTISGLLSGFTFIVVNQSQLVYTYKSDYMSTETRHNIYGLFTILAFLTSILSLMMSFILYGIINMLGKEYTAWFVVYFPTLLVDFPMGALWFAMMFIFTASIVSAGGLFQPWVWYIIIAMVILIGSIGIGTYFWVLSASSKHLLIDRAKTKKK